jgi:hypothetical protein
MNVILIEIRSLKIARVLNIEELYKEFKEYKEFSFILID